MDDLPEYLTEDGEPIPEEVAEAFVPADEWFYRDPTKIHVESCLLCNADIFLGETNESCWFCGSTEYCGADSRGNQQHLEYVGDGGYFTISGEEGFMCGYCVESFEDYGDTLLIVEPDGRYKMVYDGDVAMDWGEWTGEFDLLRGPAFEMARAIANGTHRVPVDGWRSYSDVPSEIDAGEIELKEVGGGWHSTMDRSDFSDRVNLLTSGEYHAERVFDTPWGHLTAQDIREKVGKWLYVVVTPTVTGDMRLIHDVGRDHLPGFRSRHAAIGAHPEAANPDMAFAVRAYDSAWLLEQTGYVHRIPAPDYPVAVRFGKTSNVFSMIVNVFAPEDSVEHLAEMLERAKHSGIAGGISYAA